MATREVVVDAPRRELLPPDPNVIMPRHVREAAARADAMYSKVQSQEPSNEPAPKGAAEPQTPTPKDPAQTPPDAGKDEPKPAPKAADSPQPPPQPTEPPAPPESLDAQQEHHKYLSMKGRYDALMKTLGENQEQMRLMGDELIRANRALKSLNGQQQRQNDAPPKVEKLVTPKDIETFGEDAIDLMERVARERLLPEIEALKQQNQTLSQQVRSTRTETVNEKLTREVPSWPAINRDPRWHSWLRSRDVYSGVIRQEMLDEATRAADAARVVAFFKGFLRDHPEEQTTGPAVGTPPPQPPPAPRVAAIDPMLLAAPGKPQPTPGSQPEVPADKPTYTHAQIALFYKNARKGLYTPEDKNRIEQDIFAAQRDGRIR